LLQLRQDVAAQEQVLWLLRHASARGALAGSGGADARSASPCCGGASSTASTGATTSTRSRAAAPGGFYSVDQRPGSSAPSGSQASGCAGAAQATRGRAPAGPASPGSTAPACGDPLDKRTRPSGSRTTRACGRAAAPKSHAHGRHVCFLRPAHTHGRGQHYGSETRRLYGNDRPNHQGDVHRQR
jgi:hypothetical protein